MNRQDILALEALRGYPCLTITLPTHRTSPDNRQDPIRLKNLGREVAERLTAELGKREVEAVLRSLDELVETIDHAQNLDGLALFVSADLARAERLPFTLAERVVVDESFFTRDLLFAMNRSPRYWVLALSEQPTRLFEASRDSLEELTAGSLFPMTHGGKAARKACPTTQRSTPRGCATSTTASSSAMWVRRLAHTWQTTRCRWLWWASTAGSPSSAR